MSSTGLILFLVIGLLAGWIANNLMKGAASQAVQNLNLACGFGELDGLS